MVKATRKPLDEIYDMVKAYRRVLVVGCGGCVSVCLAGGQRESRDTAEDLQARARQDRVPCQLDSFVTERQCNLEFLEDLEERVTNADCLLSMACGAGAQHLADAFPSLPVFPGLDTVFVGVDRDTGLYEERCRQCGRCMLGFTGGICPVTRCAKSLFNGPCGGTRESGECEVGGGTPCAWKEIYERLQAQGRLQSILAVRPPMDWIDKGPATLVQRGYENRYVKQPREAERG
jgi:ferredoxin